MSLYSERKDHPTRFYTCKNRAEHQDFSKPLQEKTAKKGGRVKLLAGIIHIWENVSVFNIFVSMFFSSSVVNDIMNTSAYPFMIVA